MDDNDQSEFIPFQSRKTHWGSKDHRPVVQNVATILPPGLPPQILKTLLLRIQLEDAQYNLSHINTEKEYINWLENSIDYSSWNGESENAIISKAKENCLKEINEINKEMESLYPSILPVSK
ncbi:hypothetical protein TVAG_299630 [Trichomonas vaginalis G3]|uniref:Uncharacterized protein n=1 Tax=Trichomonas vaginalis (strain ATCC PRA-98 / G3) TaxID=412133 RepID=A2FE74_TRIV3|nr:pre-mRNA branch point binding [Trichomonas vaginalis G3]EAX96803.1 hypothetical protein TVAG_299630 [Trichomonas vaginalis G3]KAI5509584.1 pre-mRNA branch point binding [Trichomonas vaginalis G3]|eukprot:XP_001309733.1 hypothetical protein [Trichomonas vaginalis G3]